MRPNADIAFPQNFLSGWFTIGLFWFAVAVLGAGVFFADGLDALLAAWQLPEYSHGPLIPILSGFLFLRQLKEFPIDPGPKRDRWLGVSVVLTAIVVGALGKLSNISDIVAYAVIIWIFGILLISFGTKTGLAFWPPVLHLVYMLPLPDTLYYKASTWLQFISSELGVWFLRLASVPVFQDGNIIDLGVYKLHVAEACSGLRYLFPILSFSYIFAVLYKGPMWHKAVLLISAAPITVVMNSVRIAVAGIIVNNYGPDWVEGFTHFFEGWVIFVACIVMLFGLARLMLYLQKDRMSLVEALDLDTDGLGTQFARLKLIRPSKALITAAISMISVAVLWQAVPQRGNVDVDREQFVLFPRQFDNGWSRTGQPMRFGSSVEEALKADDYINITLAKSTENATVDFFVAWYDDQSRGGVHSPEICLPGAGWEISWLERSDMTEVFDTETPFLVNRAIIQKGEARLMVLYWFQQRERKIAWDMAAKFWLMYDGIITGRTDGALVRFVTAIGHDEADSAAEARLIDATKSVLGPLKRFVPEN